MLHHEEYLKVAKTVANKRRKLWHDTDDIEGEILYELVKRKPEKMQYAWRIAWNARADWIRKERGSKGQKSVIRDTHPLSEYNHFFEIEDQITDRVFVESIREFADELEAQILDLLLEGHSRPDVAKVLGISNGRVHSKLKRLHKKVVAEWGEESLSINHG